jgi:gamma-glutamylcyclotransferase (GGCT)/AIG2-like uncharacterized protein YtfP
MSQKIGSVTYFAYGSNMDKTILQKYAPSARFICIAKLPRYCIKFNKKSSDGSGKANIVLRDTQESRTVWGAVYSINPDEEAKLDKKEKGYEKMTTEALVDSESPVEVVTYSAKQGEIDDNMKPTRQYMKHVIDGAKQCGLPSNYIQWLEHIETRVAFNSTI